MTALFTEGRIGGLTLDNRIVVSPMCMYSAIDGVPQPFHMAHIGSLMMSGAGLVIVEATAVESAGRGTPRCTGLYDDVNDRLEDYEPLLNDLKARGLSMICANPDKIVKVGDRLLYCAGTLAEMYARRGGEVLMAGKPYPPIYELALRKAAEVRGADVSARDVLAIGDGPETDIRGAAESGFDALLVAEGVTDASQGLAAAEAAVRNMVPEARIVRTMRALAWE